MIHRRHSNLADKILNYSITGIVICFGILILLGAFELRNDIRVGFGGVILLYGMIKLALLRTKYRKEKMISDESDLYEKDTKSS